VAGDLLYTGPEPEPGEQWCTLCAMLYKGFANTTEEVENAVSAVNELEPGQVRTIDITRMKLPVGRPQPAVATFISPVIQSIVLQTLGISPQPGMVAPPVPVPLCWSHLIGLQLKPGTQTVVIPATADMMPGGQRGAVDLSQRRNNHG
jgi:hypothetical protein